MATRHDDDSATVIGESMLIQGNLQGDEDLHVLGRVDGSIELQRTLVVAESGIVKAEVTVKNAIISGVVVGNVHASEAVELTREGRMVGDINAPRVIIVDGASFRGNVDMGDVENMPARPPRTERPRVSAPAPAPATRSRASAPPAAAPKSEDADATVEVPAPDAGTAKTKVQIKPPSGGGSSPKKKPAFLDPPKARGLPKKGKKKRSRVVVKRK